MSSLVSILKRSMLAAALVAGVAHAACGDPQEIKDELGGRVFLSQDGRFLLVVLPEGDFVYVKNEENGESATAPMFSPGLMCAIVRDIDDGVLIELRSRDE